ncbi:zincin-like metallopeptidase domain-containing protein [Sphingomonas sp. PB2P12]|uniref:ArdC family protein n=1 Tax=Sphingomonas sandaracina TaxID=3096157 RepID=UPI002FCAF7A4
MAKDTLTKTTGTLYAEVTDRIIAQLEAGRVPWVQPWDGSKLESGLPRNAGTGRRYSGINVLILWATVFERGFGTQGWLTYKQAQALGGNVRKGETGTTIGYADRFTPKDERDKPITEASDEHRRQVAFLKRFTVFNVDQCEGLPDTLSVGGGAFLGERETIECAEALMTATGAQIGIGGDKAFYMPTANRIQLPPQQAFHDQVNYYRTALHELGHWTGHTSRLDRDQKGAPRSASYAREELIAEMCSAFTCAELGIVPTVRHADYIGAWLEVLREDSRAIFRAASQASKAADYLLAFRADAADDAEQEMAA